MDSKTPYLDSIQKIPGNTAKEKRENLHKIIKQIIESKKAPGDLSLQTLYGSPIPQTLIPLIEIEIAIILKNVDHVIIALKSEDVTIVKRALKAEWVFDGSHKLVTNYHYFATNVFSEVSANTRTKIIKRLSHHLGFKNECSIAEDFFEGVSKNYDQKKAMPLLIACSQDYIWNYLEDEKVLQSRKMVNRLFSKYPELVIKILKTRIAMYWDSKLYSNLIRRLIKNHINDFIELASRFYWCLDTKNAELFLKMQGNELLITNPTRYLSLFPLDWITNKLTKDQFELMFRNLFPKNQDKFSFNTMVYYLKFQPEEQKFPLIRKIFKDLYGTDLSDALDKVTIQMMLMLPKEDRVNIAQTKLALDPAFNLNNCQESWICYLLTVDSIPLIKKEISKSKRLEDRAALVKHLIYTCKVNKSREDLLLVLQYISSRHCNELPEFWFRVYDSLMTDFDLELLSADHWKVLDEMIQRSYVKDYLTQQSKVSQNLMEKSIHYRLLNNIPIDRQMFILTELKIEVGESSTFNILSSYPKYEKQCLETFVNLIPCKFPEGNEIWKDKRLEIIQNLVKGLYEYNERVSSAVGKKKKNFKSEELLSVRKYSWLLDVVKYIVHNDCKEVYLKKIVEMKTLIQKHERELYNTWFPPKVSEEFDPMRLLKKDRGKILENLGAFLESCEENIKSFQTKRFLRECIWYAEIPVKFAEESLKKANEGNSRSLMILALLIRGPELVRILEPMIDVSNKMEIDEEDTKKSVCSAISVSRAINLVNPPPPLEWVGRFCESDWIVVGFNCLMNVAKRVSVRKVFDFVKSLDDKSIVKKTKMKKHGIRLMSFVGSTADLCMYFRHLWNTEKDQEIRDILFQKIYKLFTNQPCEETWLLMKFCIEGLKVDEIESGKKLIDLKKIPEEYRINYFEAALTKVEELVKKHLSSVHAIQLISNFISNATYKSNIDLPEEYWRVFIRKFAFDFSIDMDILMVGQNYAIQSYLLLAKETSESRLQFFVDLLSTAILNHWEDSHSENCRVYPFKKRFDEIVRDVVSIECQNNREFKVSQALMNLFPSLLQPIQAPNSYLSLFFVIEFRNAKCDDWTFGSSIGQKLPNLIEFFSIEMLLFIAYSLLDFLEVVGHRWETSSLIESLLEMNTSHSATLATILLTKKYTEIPKNKYKNIVKKLRKLNQLDIETFLNLHSVSINLGDKCATNGDDDDNSDNDMNN